MSVILKGGSSTDLATVTADKALMVQPTTDPTKAGYVVAINPDGYSPEFGDDGRIRTGQEHLLVYDPFESTTVDYRTWNVTANLMTMAKSGGYWLLNSGVATTASAYANLVSVRQAYNLTEFPMYLQWRARVIPQVNAVVEMGLGSSVGTNVTCGDGVFLRWNSAGVMQGVQSFSGAENVVTFTALNPANYYNFEIMVFEDRVVFDITGNDGVGDQRVEHQILTSQGAPMSTMHMSAFARVYNTATPPATAAQVYLSSCNLQQMDTAAERPWAAQMAHSGRSAWQAPLTPFAQTANYANSAAPASATLANGTAGYSTLGGLFQFAAVAGANTDYALFAYQVPAGHQLAITDIRISAWNTGAAVATTPTLLVWALGINSTQISLAQADVVTLQSTGFAWAARRYVLGSQSFPVGAAVGANVPDIYEDFNTPLVVEAGRLVHVILRMPVGTATVSQIIQGGVMLHGYFE